MFKWDENKNTTNQKKHGLSFEVASQIFKTPFHCPLEFQYVDNEQRWLTVGYLQDILITVVHTYSQDKEGNETIRIISARRATKPERKKYDEQYRKRISGFTGNV